MKYNFQIDALEKLLPAGFKKQRELFFIIREPTIMVLFRKFEPSGKDAFYIALTHTFFTSVKNKNGKYLLPATLEQYPLSIATGLLRAQYGKHSTVHNFDCALHQFSRNSSPKTDYAEKQNSSVRYLFRKLFKSKLSQEAPNPINITLHEGMRLLNESSPALSYQILTKTGAFQNEMIHAQMAECTHFINTT